MVRCLAACVHLNGVYSKWINFNLGLRQGSSLSSILFNFSINDLACKLKAVGECVDIGGEKLCILLYADDIVLLSDSENGIQNMLDILSDWCRNDGMVINNQKSNIMHFRPPRIGRTKIAFTVGAQH